MTNYNLEQDYRRVTGGVPESRFLEGSRIEIVRDVDLSGPPEHVLFDFDGTLSLIREGWPEVMIPLMVEVLAATGTDETAAELSHLVRDFVLALNGKQTIYQMIRLAEEVERRGGKPLEPRAYKNTYHERLLEHVGSRREGLATGRVAPEQMLVPGSLEFLRALAARGTTLYLASGTDERYVKEEAALLGLDGFFGTRIHGAVDDYRSYSKAQVIQRIVASSPASGRLLGFGDGYVEIENIKSAGGIAVAVASDEAGRGGEPDAWKRDRLIGVGADVVIPDYREHDRIIDFFWGE